MAEMWSQEYWTQKGEVKLFMWRKRLGAPEAGEASKPVLFLVHGSSFCGPTGFDLTVPGKSDYSLMEKFAEYGFDVWTLDHEGYGRSDSTDGNSAIAEGVLDLAAGMAVVERECGQKKVAFYGSSSGALRAALFAEHHPEHVAKLVLDAFVWTGEGSPTLKERAKKMDQWTKSNMREVDRDFFRSIFTRDKPGMSEQGVAEAMAEAELALCSQVPTTQHEVPGATRRFKEFLDTHAPGASLAKRRDAMYSLRSGILHGSELMQLDQDRAFGWDPPYWNEHELNDELWGLTRVALRNWLKNPPGGIGARAQ